MTSPQFVSLIHPRWEAIVDAVARHTKAGLDYVVSGHYEGEHWLATFAFFTLSQNGIEP